MSQPLQKQKKQPKSRRQKRPKKKQPKSRRQKRPKKKLPNLWLKRQRKLMMLVIPAKSRLKKSPLKRAPEENRYESIFTQAEILPFHSRGHHRD